MSEPDHQLAASVHACDLIHPDRFEHTDRLTCICTLSFQGGNVAGNQGLSQAIGYYAIAFTTAAWSGNNAILDEVNRFFPNLPQIPAYMNNALPRYSQVVNSRT